MADMLISKCQHVKQKLYLKVKGKKHINHLVCSPPPRKEKIIEDSVVAF